MNSTLTIMHFKARQDICLALDNVPVIAVLISLTIFAASMATVACNTPLCKGSTDEEGSRLNQKDIAR